MSQGGEWSADWHGFVEGFHVPEFCKYCGEPRISYRHQVPAERPACNHFNECNQCRKVLNDAIRAERPQLSAEQVRSCITKTELKIGRQKQLGAWFLEEFTKELNALLTGEAEKEQV